MQTAPERRQARYFRINSDHVSTLLVIIALWFLVSLVLAGLLAFGLARRERGGGDAFRGH